MKRAIQGLAAAIISVGCMGAAAGAESANCDSTINNTGADSHNEVTCTDSTKMSVVCKNGIYVLNDNEQSSGSGSVDADKNTTVGNISTGDAVNENGTTVKIGASCGAAAQPVTTPPQVGGLGSTTPPVAVSGGMGNLSGGAGSVVVPSGTPATVTELPNTASNPITAAAAIGTISLASLFGLSRLALFGYNRYLMR